MSTKNDKSRVKYGFVLDFPTEFTLSDLRRAKRGTVKYITLYKRVKAALIAGTIVVAGKRSPSNVRKGRQELVYKRAMVASTESAVA